MELRWQLGNTALTDKELIPPECVVLRHPPGNGHMDGKADLSTCVHVLPWEQDSHRDGSPFGMQGIM